MKILLLNPPHPSIGSRIPHEHLPPLGLLALGGPLLDAGHQVGLLDADYDGMTVRHIVEEVRRQAPDAVLLGHSGSTSGHPAAAQIARAVRDAMPYYSIGRRVWPYELWHWCFLDHRTRRGPTLAEFWHGGAEAIQPKVSLLTQGKSTPRRAELVPTPASPPPWRKLEPAAQDFQALAGRF